MGTRSIHWCRKSSRPYRYSNIQDFHRLMLSLLEFLTGTNTLYFALERPVWISTLGARARESWILLPLVVYIRRHGNGIFLVPPNLDKMTGLGGLNGFFYLIFLLDVIFNRDRLGKRDWFESGQRFCCTLYIFIVLQNRAIDKSLLRLQIWNKDERTSIGTCRETSWISRVELT